MGKPETRGFSYFNPILQYSNSPYHFLQYSMISSAVQRTPSIPDGIRVSGYFCVINERLPFSI
jgi:hypothetical protein